VEIYENTTFSGSQVLSVEIIGEKFRAKVIHRQSNSSCSNSVMGTTVLRQQTAVRGRKGIAPSGFCAAVFVLPRQFLESCHPKASTLLSQVLGAISQ
jgi:hypothetical protein